MGSNINSINGLEDVTEAEAEIRIWKYIFGFTEMAVVKCSIELGIADAIEAHGGPMTLGELSAAVRCPQAPLQRIMRFLVRHRVFKQTVGRSGYEQTPLSRRLTRSGPQSMADLVLLESSPAMVWPWQHLRRRVQEMEAPFDAAHGEDVWRYAAENPGHSKLINDAMACDARVAVGAALEGCPEVFQGVGTVVDVGGGDGTALGMLVKACPSIIRAINFDLPHVVSVAPHREGVVHVGGDMFQKLPTTDAVFIMWVLHDWGDEECIQILKKCREAIVENKDKGEGGKVIIVEAVIEEDEEEGNNKLGNVGLMLDMVMMAHTTKGKERTLKEWEHVLLNSGFSRFYVKTIAAVQSVIVAFP